MLKKTAIQYDSLLQLMINNPKSTWSIVNIIEAGEDICLTPKETRRAISIFLTDGVIERIIHSGIPEHDFGFYTISNKGIHFIHKEGGYVKQQRYQNYEDINKQFTWIRHWVWFFGFVISLLINIYLIISIYL